MNAGDLHLTDKIKAAIQNLLTSMLEASAGRSSSDPLNVASVSSRLRKDS